MKTYLVTGAAGFIGANFIKYMLAEHQDIKIVVLDLLTYAGNLGTIAGDIDGERCEFVKGDICDRTLADELFAKYNFDYVVNFAAESHVDRSIENPQLFLVTNILGTQKLLDAARRAWVTGKDEAGYPPVSYTHLDVYKRQPQLLAAASLSAMTLIVIFESKCWNVTGFEEPDTSLLS